MCRASFGRTNELPGRPSEDTDTRRSVGSACGFSCCPALRGPAHEFVSGFAKQTRHTGASQDAFIVRGCCDPAASARYRRGIFIPGGGAHAMSIYSIHSVSIVFRGNHSIFCLNGTSLFEPHYLHNLSQRAGRFDGFVPNNIAVAVQNINKAVFKI
jgi:hypothetical protein